MKSNKKVEVPTDNEFYFADSGSRMPPNADLYASPCGDTPSYVKY